MDAYLDSAPSRGIEHTAFWELPRGYAAFCVRCVFLLLYAFAICALHSPQTVFETISSLIASPTVALRRRNVHRHGNMDGFQEVDEEYEARMQAFEADCNDGKGNAVACHQVAEFLSVVKNDFNKAGKVFDMNCRDRDHAPSCFNLGRFLLAGKGMEQSDAEAEKVFEAACKKDHQPACLHLGFLHLYGGEGFKRDYKKAVDVLDSSCGGGLADSCNMLAKQLLRKDGKGFVARDPPRAEKLLEKGCSHNHGPSCYNLTVMYKKGDEGVPSDYKKYRQYRDVTEKLAAQFQGLDGNKQA